MELQTRTATAGLRRHVVKGLAAEGANAVRGYRSCLAADEETAAAVEVVQAGFGGTVKSASAVGQMGLPQAVACAASKGGVVGMTRAASAEGVRKGVIVDALPLGGFDRGPAHTSSNEMLERVAGTAPVVRFGTEGAVVDGGLR